MGHFLLGAVHILLAAQAMQATVVGTVRDAQTGTPIAGAVVALSDLDRATATDEEGRYALRQVPAGPHHIAVRSIGYASHTVHALVPRAGELEINISLSPDPVPIEPLEVRGSVIVRGIDSGDPTAYPDRECSIAAVHNHPLLSEPDVFEALGGGEVVLRPETPGGVHVRGGASDQVAYLLDGVPVFSPYHAAGVSSAWNPDAVSRMRLSSVSRSTAHSNTLSGAIEAVTRAPGARFRAQGSASSTQTRFTADGPIGAGGAGYVVSIRSGLPDVIAPKGEASYLNGETGDGLAKIEVPALGGKVRLLGYDSENDIDAAAATEDAPSVPISRRNVFEWHSQSLGVEWRRESAPGTTRVLGWSAAGDANADWTAEAALLRLTSDRRDEGLLVALERRSGHAASTVGIRAERSRTRYRIDSDSVAIPSWSIEARTPVVAAFAQHERAIGPRVELDVGATLAATRGDAYLGPRTQVRWNASAPLSFSGSYARTHQFAQSLRNEESVVGNIFPVDLHIGANAPGIPVARSDQGVVAADLRPFAGLRLGVQAYARESDGLVLVAPRSGEPFSTGEFAVGSATARGVSLDAAVSGARYGIVASYGYQHLRLEYGDSSYVPENGAAHLVETGLIVFPSATASVRLGATAAFGRRTTTIASGFEWEACNLLDQGCEFGGSPHYAGEALGGTKLPTYLRVDLGVRKHWHVNVAGRDAMIALFGTYTNLLQRKNVLTYARNQSTGELIEIEMRPPAPLVVGLDWRF